MILLRWCHYVKTWCHSCCIVIRRGPINGHRKFGDVWTCSSRFLFIAQTNRQTDKQTDATERYTHAGGYTAGVGNNKSRWLQTFGISKRRLASPVWSIRDTEILFGKTKWLDNSSETIVLNIVLQSRIHNSHWWLKVHASPSSSSSQLKN